MGGIRSFRLLRAKVDKSEVGGGRVQVSGSVEVWGFGGRGGGDVDDILDDEGSGDEDEDEE